MNIGVKAYHEEDFLDAFIGKADFFEIQAIQKYNYNFLKKYKKLNIPIVIHAEHVDLGANPADKTLEKNNIKSINYAIKLANLTGSKKIILHPGGFMNKNCSKEQSIKILKSVKDKRVLVENLSPLGNRLCQTPEQTKDFLEKTNKDLIFDLGHAIITANTLKLNMEKTVNAFLKLKPKHFHLSGININSKKDSHKSFKTATTDYKKFLKLYPKNAEITLEVTKSINKTKWDLDFIRKIITEL